MHFLKVIFIYFFSQHKVLKLLKAGSEESWVILREARGSVEKQLQTLIMMKVSTRIDS